MVAPRIPPATAIYNGGQAGSSGSDAAEPTSLYNPKPHHSTIGYLSPMAFEEEAIEALIAVHNAGSRPFLATAVKVRFLPFAGRVAYKGPFIRSYSGSGAARRDHFSASRSCLILVRMFRRSCCSMSGSAMSTPQTGGGSSGPRAAGGASAGPARPTGPGRRPAPRWSPRSICARRTADSGCARYRVNKIA